MVVGNVESGLWMGKVETGDGKGCYVDSGKDVMQIHSSLGFGGPCNKP